MAGLTDKVKGKVKELAGEVADDPGLENEGKLDQAKGSMKNAGENLKEKAKEALGVPAEEAKEAAERAEEKTRRDRGDA
ncbi:MAG TPA: CsbD family protein [Myxococcaceae bacterium]|nr:CsbD family protein [Myxococcaceae bacterium]